MQSLHNSQYASDVRMRGWRRVTDLHAWNLRVFDRRLWEAQPLEVLAACEVSFWAFALISFWGNICGLG